MGYLVVGLLLLVIYIEGVGMCIGKDDDLMGLVFGVGWIGVCVKVYCVLDVLLFDVLCMLVW